MVMARRQQRREPGVVDRSADNARNSRSDEPSGIADVGGRPRPEQLEARAAWRPKSIPTVNRELRCGVLPDKVPGGRWFSRAFVSLRAGKGEEGGEYGEPRGCGRLCGEVGRGGHARVVGHGGREGGGSVHFRGGG